MCDRNPPERRRPLAPSPGRTFKDRICMRAAGLLFTRWRVCFCTLLLCVLDGVWCVEGRGETFPHCRRALLRLRGVPTVTLAVGCVRVYAASLFVCTLPMMSRPPHLLPASISVFLAEQKPQILKISPLVYLACLGLSFCSLSPAIYTFILHTYINIKIYISTNSTLSSPFLFSTPHPPFYLSFASPLTLRSIRLPLEAWRPIREALRDFFEVGMLNMLSSKDVFENLGSSERC